MTETGDAGREDWGPNAIRVLVVDDEATFRETLCKVLGRRGFIVWAVASGEQGLEALRAEDFDVVVLDLKMPGIGGLAALREMPKVRPTTKIIMVTGHGTVATGIEAMRAHAEDFLLKPVAIEELVQVIVSAAESRRATSG